LSRGEEEWWRSVVKPIEYEYGYVYEYGYQMIPAPRTLFATSR
jgi:hypothetical protein